MPGVASRDRQAAALDKAFMEQEQRRNTTLAGIEAKANASQALQLLKDKAALEREELRIRARERLEDMRARAKAALNSGGIKTLEAYLVSIVRNNPETFSDAVEVLKDIKSASTEEKQKALASLINAARGGSNNLTTGFVDPGRAAADNIQKVLPLPTQTPTKIGPILREINSGLDREMSPQESTQIREFIMRGGTPQQAVAAIKAERAKQVNTSK
jgi:hypothetical protein